MITEARITELQRYRPIGGRVLLKPLPLLSSKVLALPEGVSDNPNLARVLAVSRGYNDPEDRMRFHPTELSPGDIVAHTKFAKEPVELDGEDYLSVHESGVFAVIGDSLDDVRPLRNRLAIWVDDYEEQKQGGILIPTYARHKAGDTGERTELRIGTVVGSGCPGVPKGMRIGCFDHVSFVAFQSVDLPWLPTNGELRFYGVYGDLSDEVYLLG